MILHDIENFWDGPKEVRDLGNGDLEYFNPWTEETDRFRADGYYDERGQLVPWSKEGRRHRHASVVDDFKSWTEENGAGNDVGAVGEFIHLHPELDSEDVGELFEYVHDNPTRREVRDFEDPYGGLPDMLYTGPGRLSPDLIFPAEDTDGDRSEFVDVTADDRDTTAPDKIVHFARFLYADTDDDNEWSSFDDGGRKVWRGPDNQGYMQEGNTFAPVTFTGRGSQGPEGNRYEPLGGGSYTHSNEGGRDLFRYDGGSGNSGLVLENGDVRGVKFTGEGEMGSDQRFDYNGDSDSAFADFSDFIAQNPGAIGGGGGNKAPGGAPANQAPGGDKAPGGGGGGSKAPVGGSPGGGGSPSSGGSGGSSGSPGGSTGGGGGWQPNGNTEKIGPGDYTIQSGDTLSQIAERAGLGADNYQQLADANNIANPDLIYAGDTIKIPGGDTSDSDGFDPDWSFMGGGGNGTAGSNGGGGADTGSPADVGFQQPAQTPPTGDNPPAGGGTQTPAPQAPGAQTPGSGGGDGPAAIGILDNKLPNNSIAERTVGPIADFNSPENTNPGLMGLPGTTGKTSARFLYSDDRSDAADDTGGLGSGAADALMNPGTDPDATPPSSGDLGGGAAPLGGGGGGGFDPSAVMGFVQPVLDTLTGLAGPIGEGIGSIVNGISSGIGRLSHVRTADLLERLRELSDEDAPYGHMDAHNDEIREVVEELRDRGFDASPHVASVEDDEDVHEPWHGSGPARKQWWETSRHYVEQHERPRHVDVTEGDGIIKYTAETPQQRAARLVRTAGRKFSLDEQRALESEEHPLGARNLPTEEDLRGTHYLS